MPIFRATVYISSEVEIDGYTGTMRRIYELSASDENHFKEQVQDLFPQQRSTVDFGPVTRKE